MSMNAFTAEVAAERRRDLLRGAADHRVAHATHRGQGPARANRLNVRIRPLRPTDGPLLAAIFDGLTPASRLARYLFPKRVLTSSELHHFTNVDHHDHEAVIALTRLRGEPIGVARFIREIDDPTVAEVAVEVVDAWQNLGVGSMLAARLAERAVFENVTHFTALMSADNRRSKRLLTKMGAVTHVSLDGATVSYRIALPAPARIPQPRRTAPLTAAGCAS